MLLVSALACADLLLMPTQTEPMAVRAVDGMLRSRALIEKSRGSALPGRIVATLFDRRTRAGCDSLRQLERSYPELLSDHCIPVDTQLREASRLQTTVDRLDAHGRAAVAYRLLTEELLALDRDAAGKAVADAA